LTLVGYVSTLAILFPAKKYWSTYNSGVTNMWLIPLYWFMELQSSTVYIIGYRFKYWTTGNF